MHAGSSPKGDWGHVARSSSSSSRIVQRMALLSLQLGPCLGCLGPCLGRLAGKLATVLLDYLLLLCLPLLLLVMGGRMASRYLSLR